MIGRDKLKNKSYSEAIQQMIEKGEVEEIQEDPMEARNMDRAINYLPIMECLNLIAFLRNVALYLTPAPKILKECR